MDTADFDAGKRTGERRPRRAAEFWGELVAQWRSSGLSQRAFCAKQGVAYSTFSVWAHGKRGRAAAKAAASFLEVPLPQDQDATAAGTAPNEASPASLPAVATDSCIELSVSGVRVRLSGTHADRLMRILVTRIERAGF